MRCLAANFSGNQQKEKVCRLADLEWFLQLVEKMLNLMDVPVVIDAGDPNTIADFVEQSFTISCWHGQGISTETIEHSTGLDIVHQQRNILVIWVGKDSQMLRLGIENLLAVGRRLNNFEILQKLVLVGFDRGWIVGVRKG